MPCEEQDTDRYTPPETLRFNEVMLYPPHFLRAMQNKMTDLRGQVHGSNNSAQTWLPNKSKNTYLQLIGTTTM